MKEPCGREAFLGAKLLRPGATSSDAALPSASATVSLHNLQLETEHSVSNFLVPPKFGYPGLAADSTLVLCSLLDAVVGLHEKRPALPKKLKELHKKGKELNV